MAKNDDPARKEQVRRWVETRPRSHREPAGRDDKHPRKGHKSDWKDEEDGTFRSAEG